MAITVFIQKIVYLRFNFLIRYSIFSQLHYIIYSFGCLGYRLLLFLTASFTCFFSIYLSFFSDVFFREVDMSIKKSFICVRSVAFLSKNVHSVSKVGVLCQYDIIQRQIVATFAFSEIWRVIVLAKTQQQICTKKYDFLFEMQVRAVETFLSTQETKRNVQMGGRTENNGLFALS